jgi:hypothetical protein
VYSAIIPYQPQLRAALMQLKGMILINQFGNELRIVASPELKQAELDAAILNTTGNDFPLKNSELNLEDVFIALTQSKAEQV